MSDEDKYHDPRSPTFRVSTKLRKLINKALDYKADDCPKELRDQVRHSQTELKELMSLEKENREILNYSQIEDLHKYLQRILADYDWFFYQVLQECKEFKNPEKKVRYFETIILCALRIISSFDLIVLICRKIRSSSKG